MGIRGLLRILLQGLGTSNMKLLDPKRRTFVIARMYIDMAQFVYKGLNQVEADMLMSEVKRAIDDDMIIAATIKILLEQIREISPRNFLGIYFDGIPPLAKVVEQRARRYEMENPGVGKFSTVKITVGTAFMRRVVEEVVAALAANVSVLPPEVEVSTPSEKGEGEHKLANRIRDKDASQPGVKVIVSDDSDIIIMSLLNSWRDCYIFFDRKDQGRATRGLLSVSGVAERIRHRLGDTPTAVFDFCLLVILTGGNDFMPTILSARQRQSVITELMDLYGPILKGQPLMTNQGRDVVWASVRSLVNELASNEERRLRDLAVFAKKKGNGRMPALFTRSMDPTTGVLKLPLFRRAWDEELYQPKLGGLSLPESVVIIPPSQREIDADHSFSAMQYLQGLAWTLAYMRTSDGPDWYYSASYPPLFGDVARIMTSIVDPTRALRSLPAWEPQDLAVYLLTVLPRETTQELFGETFANAFAFGAGIGDLFPKKFRHFAPVEWDATMKGRAILPPLGLERIRKVVAERVDAEVVERNLKSIQPLLRFSHKRGQWQTPGLPLPAQDETVVRRTRCGRSATDYEILDPVIPSMTHS